MSVRDLANALVERARALLAAPEGASADQLYHEAEVIEMNNRGALSAGAFGAALAQAFRLAGGIPTGERRASTVPGARYRKVNVWRLA